MNESIRLLYAFSMCFFGQCFQEQMKRVNIQSHPNGQTTRFLRCYIIDRTGNAAFRIKNKCTRTNPGWGNQACRRS